MSMLKSSRYPELNDVEWLKERITHQSINAIATELGAPRTSVTGALKRHGLYTQPVDRLTALREAMPRATKPIRQWETITQEDIERAYFQSDASLDRAAKALGCCASTLLKAMRRYGIYSKSHGRQTPKFQLYPQLSDRDWLMNELETKSQTQIAYELGTTSGNASDHVKRYGLRASTYTRGEAVREGDQ